MSTEEKRPKTGLHTRETDPVQLEQWLTELNPTEVQINFQRKIYRGPIAQYEIGAESDTGTIFVSFEKVYVADYPKRPRGPVIWERMLEGTNGNEFDKTSLRKKIRVNGVWVTATENSQSAQVSRRMFYSYYYRSRDYRRIKVFCGSASFQWFQNKGYWRFFAADDPTNLFLNEEGKIAQEAVIV